MKRKIPLNVLTIVLSTFCLSLGACSKGGGDSSQEPSQPSSSDTSLPSSEESSIHPASSSEPEEEKYNIVRPDYTPEYTKYELSPAPTGLNMTYYSDIYSRGFAWATDRTANQTELYLVESDKGEEADFDDAEVILGETIEFTYQTDGNFVSPKESLPKYRGSSNGYELQGYDHRVHVENLEKGKAYSYKVGSEEGYAYGAFIVEKDDVETITALNMSDAQTKDPSKLNVWRNTFTRAVSLAGEDLDFALYNGDQFDQNIERVNSSDQHKPNRFLSYTKALDIIGDYKFNIPYMASSGNHEPTAPYSHYLLNDIDYGGFDYSGGYYSFDYKFAHFVVLNTSLKTVDDAQMNWLKADLDAASDAKWKIVMMHVSPHSTGDNSNKTDIQKLLEKVTPVFSEKHVDLVLQAHDHTYSKTLPYLWDAAGYTTTWNNAEVVNLDPDVETINDITYDKNPGGTYYVTTGAAGHRCGAAEADGVWAEVVKDGNEYKGLDPSKTFLDNKYKIQLGRLNFESQFEPYKVNGYTSDQHYEIGDLATGNVNAQMFGLLNITEETLSYYVYAVNDDTTRIFDSLDILKD